MKAKVGFRALSDLPKEYAGLLLLHIIRLGRVKFG